MTISTHSKFPSLHQVQHPLLQHKLAVLRAIDTKKKAFKELLNEISVLLAYEATKNLPLKTQKIQTPLETFEGKILADDNVVIIPILRAGIGMVDGFLSLLPNARVAHIGLFRDEASLKPQSYYFKIPEKSQDKQYFLCDPMLATGGSAVAAVDQLKKAGIKNIIFVCIVSAPEGVEFFAKHHPDIPIYTACLDRQLNEHGYILPGLGDAGDRLFGTK